MEAYKGVYILLCYTLPTMLRNAYITVVTGVSSNQVIIPYPNNL